MDKEVCIRNMELNIQRFDHYYNSVNAKSTFILSFNTFLLGLIIINFKEFTYSFNSPCIQFLVYIIELVLVISNILSQLFCIFAIRPYLKDKKSYKSLLFFDSISSMNNKEYKLQIERIDSKNYLRDLIIQNRLLANGLSKKFRNINISLSFLLFGELSLISLLALVRILGVNK